ncbi:MAG TPA: hypothetical protein ACFYEK_05970 [Candidatus Wunengus sp. YC60]|uniref:hypothetical protein n=1 Tax=Candidatus Wunengus sp. YC60 TaxID=3367697 RepID=UPI00402581E1
MEISDRRLEFMDRGKVDGFVTYFSYRQGDFKETFGREYSKAAAVEEFSKIKKMKWGGDQEVEELR